MPVKQKKPRPAAPTVAAIVAHPLRARCWIALTERVASPNELKNEFGAAIGDVSYHVGVLEKLGHVELVDTKPRRGAIEHFYRAIERPVVSEEEHAAMSFEERSQIAELIVQLAFADAAVALDRKTLADRTDHCTVRLRDNVDDEGFSELSALYTETLERTFDIVAKSADRLAADSDSESIPISADLMLFEMPEPQRRTNSAPSS